MKFYMLKLFNNNYFMPEPIEVIEFKNGKSFNNLNKYFQKDNTLFNIKAYNKKGHKMYEEWYTGTYKMYYYNDQEECIFEKTFNEEDSYPSGKEKYDEYMLKCKKEKQ